MRSASMTHPIPERACDALDLYGPMLVADFGAGAGFFAIAAARKISSEGKVFAFDVQEAPLAVLRATSRAMHLHNVFTLRADLERPQGSGLADANMDRVIAAHILFQAPDKDALLTEAFRILKKGGKILIVEWRDTKPGPEPHRRLTQKSIENMLASHGFVVEKTFALSEHHLGITAKK